MSSGKKNCGLACGQNSHTRAAISFHLVLHTPEHAGGDHLGPTKLETNWPNLLLSRFTALESGHASRFPTSLHSSTKMQISWGDHLVLQVERMISGILTVRHVSGEGNSTRRSYRGNGKEHGSYSLGFKVRGLGISGFRHFDNSNRKAKVHRILLGSSF